MSALITFYDFDPWFHKPCNNVSWFKSNKIGYLDSLGCVTYAFMRGSKRVKLQDFASRKYAKIMLENVPNLHFVDRYFIENLHSAHSFSDGIDALAHRDHAFFDFPISMPKLNTIPRGDFSLLKNIIKLGDFVFTRDLDSRISTIIANIDHGSWSHVAMYVDDGRVCEAVTAGVIERPLENYNYDRYRIGLYRVSTMTPIHPNMLVSSARSQLGEKYNYLGVARLGLRKLFEFRERAYGSPNDLARRRDLQLIALI